MKTYSDLQEIYDVSVTGLASQGFQNSYAEDGTCAYRGTNGRKCAIGWCIPDDKYSPEIELKSIATILGDPKLKMVLAHFPYHVHVETLRELQMCHDLSYTTEGMRIALYDFGRKHRLQIPEILQ